MTVKDLIKANLALSDNVVSSYVGDLTDAELAETPAPGMNPIAWQIGHLIAGERMMVEMVNPGASPALPHEYDALFGGKGAPEGAAYPTKDALLATWKTQREATLAAIDAFEDAKLDEPSGVSYAPTKGLLFNMLGGHAMMHVGQWVVVRRKHNKPITI